ncbi:hypothetical protein [Allocoleopsis sp.]|uniref:hypothetical protein n=1 Tax=Allocoleopsis sp. TaxID=3088169 RepID=UPI002FCED61D
MFKDVFGITTFQPAVELAVDFIKDLNDMPQVASDISDVGTQVVDKILKTPGITQCRGSHFKSATPKFKLKDGTILKTYKNSVGVNHVFLADSSGKMIFGGYVGWIYSDDLKATIAEIKETFV